MDSKILKKAVKKIAENLEKGRRSYRLGNYDVEFRSLTQNEAYPKCKEQYTEPMYYEFSLIHYGTKTCTVRTYIEEDGTALIDYGAEVVFLGGWGTVSDTNSINQFLNFFNVDGYVNGDKEYVKDDLIYDFSDLENPNKKRSLQERSTEFLRIVRDLYKTERSIPNNQLIKWVEEKIELQQKRAITKGI